MAEEKNIQEQEPEKMFIELVDQQDSGFILDGTEGTPHEQQLRAPGICFIPNVGYRRSYRVELNRKGEEVKIPFNEKIRYIRNQPEISFETQTRLGLNPAPKYNEDDIAIEKGNAMIVREGDTALYDYLKEVFYNESVNGRSEKATAIYREIQLEKRTERDIDEEMIVAEAVSFIMTLREKREDGGYTYNQEKIDGICDLLSIFAEQPSTKIKAMIAYAKEKPKFFLEKVKKWDDTTQVEVMHALQFDVIKFERNIAQYVGKNKVITSVGTDQNMKKEKKIEKLAMWLRTAEGHAAYMELKAEIDLAKEKKLQNP